MWGQFQATCITFEYLFGAPGSGIGAVKTRYDTVGKRFRAHRPCKNIGARHGHYITKIITRTTYLF